MPAALRARRGPVAAVLLLLIGLLPATAAASNPPARPSTAVATEALTAREQAGQPSSRSVLRSMLGSGAGRAYAAKPDPARPRAGRPGPQPQASAPQVKPKPKPKPPPQSTPRPRPESAPAPEAERQPQRPAPIGGLSQRQMDHAATIVRVGREMGLPQQAYVVALATALQESYLRALANPSYPESYNLPNDGTGQDHDSLGLFQQRPASGWGSVADCLDPARSARAFYRALQQVPGWQSLPVTVAAQTVQVSAFPDHYAKHEPLARQLVAALT